MMAVEQTARYLWQALSFSALLYRWEDLPETWRENWRALGIRFDAGEFSADSSSDRSVDSTDRGIRR